MIPENGSQHVVFNKISVNSIDSASGIFIGSNIANGWSSVRKDNTGFGSVQGGTVQHNCNLVYDNDHVDFPVNEHDVFVNSQTFPEAQNISFQSIDVNAVTANSTVSVGGNNQTGWSSTGKYNSGEGRHTGISVVHHNVNAVIDDDTVDAPVVQNTAHINGPSYE